jgi:prepilin-type N-terminal cleavage/methylation domain-containing protein
MKSYRGYSLIEVLIVAVIIGIGVMAVSSLFVDTQKGISRVQAQSKNLQTLQLITKSVLARSQYFPTVLESEASKVADVCSLSICLDVCYTREGSEVAKADASCFFKLKAYRVVLQDRKFADTSRLSWLPIHRVNFDITYKENDMDKVLKYSRLKTAVINQ